MSKLMSVKRLKELAWKAISKYVRERDNGICVTCGKKDDWQNMDCGHYRSNSERNQSFGGNELWYDLRNLNCQCFRCNRMLSGNQAEYALFLERKYGNGILQELDLLHRTYKLWTRQELEKIIYEKT